MTDAKEVKFTLKVMINKQKNKLLFAEVDSDFTDVLLSFLTLPLGAIVRVLQKHYGDEAPRFGSLTTLYNGLANLDSDHFCTEGCKLMLFNPRSSFEAEYRKLKLDINDTQVTKYFGCEERDCVYSRSSNMSLYYGVAKCYRCGKSLTREFDIKVSCDDDGGDEGGIFANEKACFLISDDLRMVPNVEGSVMETLNNLGVTEIDAAEMRGFTFGFNEIVDLLKGSLLSQSPLADIIPSKRLTCSTASKSEPGILYHNEMTKESTCDSNKMVLKVMLQKSTNKLLFAQSDESFVDFLFSLLTIPLGGVESLLGGNTCLKNIDNLYRSLENINGDKYLRTPDTKSRLINPKLPWGYITNGQILPLSQESVPLIYYHFINGDNAWLSATGKKCQKTTSVDLVDFVIDHPNYIIGPTMYMITDDLSITPLRMASSLSILQGLKIALSDVKEVEFHIGLEEALSILKASLTSTSALTDGLKINPKLKKKPKQEH